MRKTFAACALLLLPAKSIAQGAVGAGPASPDASRFLRIEESFWGLYGVRLTRPGQGDLGPGFLTLDLAKAVRGSPEAEMHAGHAKLWASFNLGFALATAGLLATSIVTYPHDHGDSLAGWPDFVPQRGDDNRSALLNLGWLISLSAAVVCRYGTYEEIMMSVNSYNLDVVEGRVR